jgi:dTDP-4-amino-4,6-dideoxygalactose transaminase
MVVTSDPECARTVRMLRDWGQDRKYHHVLKGFNYRMEGLQGSILRVKLRHLDRWTEARRTHARGYDALLADSELTTPTERPWARHVYHVYAVRTRAREALQRTLHANGVQTGIHYPIPVHLQPAYADLGYRAGQFPQAERAADEVLSLPMYPELSRTQREMVGAVMRDEAYVI